MLSLLKCRKNAAKDAVKLSTLLAAWLNALVKEDVEVNATITTGKMQSLPLYVKE